MNTYWLILIGIIAVIVVSGCTGIPNNPSTSGYNGVVNSVCDNIVPNTMEGYMQGNEWFASGDKTLRFANGWELLVQGFACGQTGRLICHKGSSQGENVNYLYCDGLYAHKKEIAADGTIKSDSYYKVSIVLKETSRTPVMERFYDEYNPTGNDDVKFDVVSYQCSATEKLDCLIPYTG